MCLRLIAYIFSATDTSADTVDPDRETEGASGDPQSKLNIFAEYPNWRWSDIVLDDQGERYGQAKDCDSIREVMHLVLHIIVDMSRLGMSMVSSVLVVISGMAKGLYGDDKAVDGCDNGLEVVEDKYLAHSMVSTTRASILILLGCLTPGPFRPPS